MLKAFIYAGLLLLSATFIHAADNKIPEDPEYKELKIKNSDWEKDRPKVEDSRDNIIIENNPAANPLENTPADCLAARIADKGRNFEWRAKWHFEGAGGPRLPDAAASPDGSIFAIVEVTGAANGPFSSRLVLINAYNFKCIRIIEIPEVRIARFIFLPGNDSAACIQEPQLSFKQTNQVFLLDLASGVKGTETPSFTSKVTGLAAMPDNRLMVKTAESAKIYVFNLQNLAADPATLNTPFKGGVLAAAEDGVTLIAAGKGKALFFNLQDGQTAPVRESELPTEFNPDRITLCSDDGSLFAAADGKDVICTGTEKARVLARNAGSVLGYDKKNKRLMAALTVKSALAFYDMPKFEPAGVCYPKNGPPLTRGDIISLTAVKSSILILDSHGNLFLMRKIRNTWKKNLLLEAIK